MLNAMCSRRPAVEIALVVGIGVLLIAGGPALLTDFRMGLLAKFLTFAMVALAIDLAWGYAGMLSLGHGVFFGLGAYALAMRSTIDWSFDSSSTCSSMNHWRNWWPRWSPFDRASAAILSNCAATSFSDWRARSAAALAEPNRVDTALTAGMSKSTLS